MLVFGLSGRDQKGNSLTHRPLDIEKNNSEQFRKITLIIESMFFFYSLIYQQNLNLNIHLRGSRAHK